MTDLTVAVAVTDAAGLTTKATSTITVSGAQTIVNIGETAILANFDNGNANLLCAQPITLTQPSSLQSLSFWVGTIGGQLRLGLYSGASSPNMLVAQTAAFTPLAGWNTQPATSQMLSPGQYWLVYLPQSNTLAFRKADTGGTSYLKNMVFGAMPATFPTNPSTTPSHWSFYGTFSTTPPPPPPHTPIGIGLSNVSVTKPPNANSVVGVVNVTMADGGAYTGQLILGGTDAAKFALTHGGVLPCNLVIGPTDIPAGNYSINLTAS